MGDRNQGREGRQGMEENWISLWTTAWTGMLTLLDAPMVMPGGQWVTKLGSQGREA